MLEIRKYPDPVLRQKAAPVEIIDDELRRLAADMIETMYANKGVGLAAPQVGVSRRLFVVDLDPEQRDPRVLINPVFRSRSKGKESQTEGCLSLPTLEARVSRSASVVVEAQDLDGQVVEYAVEGLAARAMQHENDHLDGILFVDKASPAAKISLQPDLEQLEHTYAAGHPG